MSNTIIVGFKWGVDEINCRLNRQSYELCADMRMKIASLRDHIRFIQQTEDCNLHTDKGEEALVVFEELLYGLLFGEIVQVSEDDLAKLVEAKGEYEKYIEKVAKWREEAAAKTDEN